MKTFEQIARDLADLRLRHLHVSEKLAELTGYPLEMTYQLVEADDDQLGMTALEKVIERHAQLIADGADEHEASEQLREVGLALLDAAALPIKVEALTIHMAALDTHTARQVVDEHERLFLQDAPMLFGTVPDFAVVTDGERRAFEKAVATTRRVLQSQQVDPEQVVAAHDAVEQAQLTGMRAMFSPPETEADVEGLFGEVHDILSTAEVARSLALLELIHAERARDDNSN